MSANAALSISEISNNIKQVLQENLERVYWIVGEIGEISVNFKGHCYLELLDKEEFSENITARIKATIWAQKFRMIEAYFSTSTGQELSEGMKVLIKARVEYHELYGISLNILDIDPSFTVGELARQKQLIINQLVEEGIFGMNKELQIPEVPQRIAIISSEKAAGYQDFMTQITQNPYGYCFHTTLFQASMQGKETTNDIIRSLDQIYSQETDFDIVAIIRGGGSQSDLNSFNTYDLAANVTQFPLPVITGIGHEKDDTILDLVAHTRLKTPTAVAEFLVSVCLDFESDLNKAARNLRYSFTSTSEMLNTKIQKLEIDIHKHVQSNMHINALQLEQMTHRLPVIANVALQDAIEMIQTKINSLQAIPSTIEFNHQKLNYLQLQTSKSFQHLLKLSTLKLQTIEEKILYLSPNTILSKGYSITMQNGKILKNSGDIDTSQTIDTKLHKGSFTSKPI
jgi:exodeoxyribonuclease VII large subunit